MSRSVPVTLKPRAASMHASEPMPVPAIATRCTWRIAEIGGISGGIERLADEVVHERAQRERAPARDQVHAVGEQRDHTAALEIDPETRAGESGVADRARREVLARRRAPRRRRVPAERPVALGRHALAPEELG